MINVIARNTSCVLDGTVINGNVRLDTREPGWFHRAGTESVKTWTRFEASEMGYDSGTRGRRKCVEKVPGRFSFKLARSWKCRDRGLPDSIRLGCALVVERWWRRLLAAKNSDYACRAQTSVATWHFWIIARAPYLVR
jgi:hypothetical protein